MVYFCFNHMGIGKLHEYRGIRLFRSDIYITIIYKYIISGPFLACMVGENWIFPCVHDTY